MRCMLWMSFLVYGKNAVNACCCCHDIVDIIRNLHFMTSP